MHAIFVAHGPFAENLKAVRRREKRSLPDSSDEESRISVVEGFKNLEVYGLVARLLGIPERSRAPHNGTEGVWDTYLEG